LIDAVILNGVAILKGEGDEYFSFRMLLIVFCWIAGTIMMTLSVVVKIDVFWGLALVLTGIVLLIADFLLK
jgi:hypothetical protein